MNCAGVYISIPYCRQKCTYCNFASASRPIAELPQYLSALEREIRDCRSLWRSTGLSAEIPPRVDSVYMGGGTPGLLTATQMHALLDAVRQAFALQPDAEITIEASPENVTPESAAAWAACGINRVSLGVQSMVSVELRAVGRMHTIETVRSAAANLRRAGIANISLDLIAGLPHQTAASWKESLGEALALAPPHLSVYMLEVDEDSRLGSELLRGGARYGAGAVPSEELIVELYERAIERLAEAGLERYEISNFSIPGRASRHNEKYWTHAPYAGFGVDAHSYDGLRRWANSDSISGYIEQLGGGLSPVSQRQQLTPEQMLEERFFLGLRRCEGIALEAIYAQFGDRARAHYHAKIRTLCGDGWLELDGDRLRLTAQGVIFSNEVFAELLA
jgi:putative oxygen-independent coproporphyrinogen III oxidase